MADDHLSNTLKAYIAPCPDTFEAKIVEMAVAISAMARCRSKIVEIQLTFEILSNKKARWDAGYKVIGLFFYSHVKGYYN